MNIISTSGENTAPRTTIRKRGCLFFITRGLKWLGISLLALLILGFAYQTIAEASDKQSFRAPGQIVAVNGHNMHIYCTGEGAPTIVLEAGAYSFSSEWYWVQKQLAPTNRICSYDRAGYGWSEPVTGLRDGLTLVRELHDLLAAANVPGPYMFAGHSLGAVLNRIYAQQYPDDVMGIVMVDGAIPLKFASKSEFQAKWQEPNSSAYALLMGLVRVGAGAIIITREFFGYGYPAASVFEQVAFRATPQDVDTWDAEFRLAQWELGEQSRAAEQLGELPIVNLWASHPELTDPADRVKLQAIWDLVPAFSSNYVVRVVNGADHGSIIGNEQYAKQVSDTILGMIDSIRTGKPVAQ